MTARKKSSLGSIWLGVLFAIVLVFGIHTILSFWLPYMSWRKILSINSIDLSTPCPEGDTDCVQRKFKDFNKTMAIKKKIYAPLEKVKTYPEFIQELKHHDKTFCYLTNTPVQEVSSDELETWLAEYGKERFIDMLGFFVRGRQVFEQSYHQPTPTDAEIAAAAKLKWRHIPWGKTWRNYNTAVRFWSWSPKPPHSRIPESALKEVIPHFKVHGAFFTMQNIFRLSDLAKTKP